MILGNFDCHSEIDVMLLRVIQQFFGYRLQNCHLVIDFCNYNLNTLCRIEQVSVRPWKLICHFCISIVDGFQIFHQIIVAGKCIIQVILNTFDYLTFRNNISDHICIHSAPPSVITMMNAKTAPTPNMPIAKSAYNSASSIFCFIVLFCLG